MAFLPGYSATVKMTGTAVAMTSEATTSISSSEYRITNSAHRILDPSASVTVYDNAVSMGASSVLVNYLFGHFNHATASFTGPVTVDASYLPTYTLATVKDWRFNHSMAELEETAIGDSSRNYLMGLSGLEGEINLLDVFETDIDTAEGGTQSVATFFAADTPKLLEFTVGSGSNVILYRAWVRFPELSVESSFEDLVKGRLKFIGCAQSGAGAGAGEFAGFNFDYLA